MTATTHHTTAAPGAVRTDTAGIHQALSRLEQPCYIVDTGQGIGATSAALGPSGRIVTAVGPLAPESLGSSGFRARHGVRYAYMGGAMAGGIASEDLVIALARSGALASFGAAGLLPERIERALSRFASEIPGLTYAANLIHSPSEDALERDGVELFLKHQVRCVEASAFMDLTPHVVRYRAAGLHRAADGRVHTANRLIAKVSRTEVAERFMRPAPEAVLTDLVARGLITAEQRDLARQVPMADDITAEADSGGHTDRRPLTALFPALLRTRDTVQRELRYDRVIGVGAGGGIGTPRAAAAAFAMGADYVVVGSVHQSCLESGTSDAARRLLVGAGLADFEMAPAADMFELGVELQVLKKGTLFPMRAKKLYDLYKAYDGIEALPADERQRLEKQMFRRSLDEIWTEVEQYFGRRDLGQLQRAQASPRRRMALIFRWYLGMASRWAVTGEADRTADYQVWCGPAMGDFNEWVRGTYLAAQENRRAADVAHHLMRGAAFTARVNQLATSGVRLPAACTEYVPTPGTTREEGR
ncbi:MULTISPECIES: PfaD family polyunsaturated fatty acid/polyketide biosynthesis protein [unclassified Streptomyces]|uniref:PfaD family polyunsaturated fatty acid/polyketide biosynthesis protein n=1 Tax=unclassified Streptomyces TaxID=2593676 RepID=UPI000CD4EA38|nr:PfaD family polyunsaturated fatty acid/polyketide biosynthesis protein [Streptomyces sp. SM1]